MSQIQRFNLFISYSKQDIELVQILAKNLDAYGIYVLYDENSVAYGQNWKDSLTKTLMEADGVLVLLTPNSINSSYVMNEIGMARALEKKLFLPVVKGDVKIPDFISDVFAIIWRDSHQEVIRSILTSVDNFRNNVNPNQSTTDESNVGNIGQRVPKKAANKAAKPKKTTKSTSTKQNYWLLKMNPSTWDIGALRIGYETYFNTHFFNDKRPEHHLFSKIAKGDIVLGYATGDYKSITCQMTVLSPVANNITNGEGFTMLIHQVFTPQIPLSHFENIFNEIAFELKGSHKPSQLFHELNESQYQKIISYDSENELQFNHNYQPYFLTEGTHTKTMDQLEFEADYKSFASVISLNSVTPPLAIGLFGNWGSGKSFFMEKLEAEININTDSQNKDYIPNENYIKNVVQVRFNSWHYSDSNLWASLTTQIFESLYDFAKKKKYGEEAIKNMYKELEITNHQLEETKIQLVENSIQLDLIKEQKNIVLEDLKEKRDQLAMWNVGDLIQIALSDPLIKKDFEKLNSEFKTEKLIQNVNEIDNKLKEIEGAGSQIIESFKLLKENSKGKWLWIWFWAAFFAVAGWLVLGPLKNTINDFIHGGIIVTGFILGWITNLIHKLNPYFIKIRQFYNRLTSLKATVEKEKAKLEATDKATATKSLNEEIQHLETEKQKIEINLSEKENKKEKLKTQIQEIGNGKLLVSFLENKTTDDAYIKQLGIISWIRKDFAKLNELFKNQKTVQNQEQNLPTEVQIDRIVLYIDDLDRCNEDIVVKVLEAIHLLLAFELFVVVVGVDPRWLNNALSEKYKNLFGKSHDKPTVTNQFAGIDDDDENVMNGIATSYDYLEKIFQIPFTLKPINKTGREKLIGYLVKDEMANEDSPNTTSLNKNAEEPERKTDKNVSIKGSQNRDPKTTLNQNPPTQLPGKKQLKFTKDEIAYMQKMSYLFGKTPRTINRYVNIYRIIKAHDNLKTNSEYSKNDYMPIMFILGIIVGYSADAKELIAEIANAGDLELFSEFLQNVSLDEVLKKQIQSSSNEVDTIQMRNFKKNIELISRFSFRTLIIDN